jgi:hypothetical protein
MYKKCKNIVTKLLQLCKYINIHGNKEIKIIRLKIKNELFIRNYKKISSLNKRFIKANQT